MIPRRFSAHGGRWGTLLWPRRTYGHSDLVSKAYGYTPADPVAAIGFAPFIHAFKGMALLNRDTSSPREDPQSID